MTARHSRPRARRRTALLTVTSLTVAAAGIGGVAAIPIGAEAADITAVTATSGEGVNNGGVLYVKSGATVTVTVATDLATRCVRVDQATQPVQFVLQPGQGGPVQGPGTWTFTVIAPSGEGIQNLNVRATNQRNAIGSPTPNCAGAALPIVVPGSYVIDNTGPAVSGTATPAPNAAGWHNSDVTVTWSATDGGVGVATGPTPASSTVTEDSDASGTTVTSSATDRLGNSGSGSVTVKLDETAPTIDGSRTPAANAAGWNNSDVTVSFDCGDDLSGIKSCTGPTTLTADGAGQSVTGTAVDNADNSATATVDEINIDTVAPTLSGAPTTAPDGDNGWYRGDVTVAWDAADALSGLAAPVPDSTITGEGTGLTASATATDKAENATTAASSPVKIDRTAPVTTANAPANWTNADVTVTLSADDALSGVAETRYTVDGGAEQVGTSVPFTAEGTYELSYWSVDEAGNAETPKTATIRIDRTAPTIVSDQDPEANSNGWNAGPVTVTFTCEDTGGSGIASCTGDMILTGDGKDQEVPGTATDNAGNSASATRLVSIDTAAPTVTASASPDANAAGWRNTPVTVTYSCGDALSGIDTCSPSATLNEGENQSATGTATDAAGNTASATVSDIDVDLTEPTITGTPSGPKVGDWYTGDVTVAWTCEDALSGLAGTCPAAETLTGEGDGQAASASVSDVAGNEASATVTVKIDRTAPDTTATPAGEQSNGWYIGAPTVTLDAIDPLSGVAKTYYRVGGSGDFAEYSAPFEVTGGGEVTVEWYSVDTAGNTEQTRSTTLRIDTIEPGITLSRSPEANGFGWVNVPVTVAAECQDAESGIAACTASPDSFTTEGADQSSTGTATDTAGNTAGATLGGINIDLTPPTLQGTPATPANAAGWYRDDVVVQWDAQDGLSGIDPDSVPAASTITGEGAALTAGPETVADKAGNVSDPASVTVKIDRTKPTITGSPTTAPNASGWYTSAVTVGFTCGDTLSGVAECPTEVTTTAEGSNVSVTSGTARDEAGNIADGITVAGLKVDGTPPQTTADNQCTATNGYCTGPTATVVLRATDTVAGVKEIRYTVGTGTQSTVPGATATVQVPLDGSGEATVTYYAVDNADNVEPLNSVRITYDNIAPTVTHSLSPAANANGWNNTPATVAFSAVDNDNGSGVAPGTVTAPVTVSADTPGQLVTGSAKDLAGNTGTDKVIVKVDRTAPTITAAVTGVTGSNGWYTGPVTVRFSCTDALSGVATCSDPVDLITDGVNQSVPGAATDKAGNTAATTAGGIKIDATKPSIATISVANGAHYPLGAVPAPTCTATDATSGVASCTVTVRKSASGVGTVWFTATATDKAGNTKTQTGSYTVRFLCSGFFHPILNFLQRIGFWNPSPINVYRHRSTIPLTVQLKRADGSVVRGDTAPVLIAPVRLGLMSSPHNQTGNTTTAGTTGSAFTWDAAAQQWVFALNTSDLRPGYLYRVGAELEDGSETTVVIGLR